MCEQWRNKLLTWLKCKKKIVCAYKSQDFAQRRKFLRGRTTVRLQQLETLERNSEHVTLVLKVIGYIQEKLQNCLEAESIKSVWQCHIVESVIGFRHWHWKCSCDCENHWQFNPWCFLGFTVLRDPLTAGSMLVCTSWVGVIFSE